MKNKILGLACIIAIAVLGTFNVNLTNSVKNNGDINLEMILSTANAQTENDWTLWYSQGLTKDERELSVKCPDQTTTSTGGSVSGTYGGGAGTVSGGTTTTSTNSSGQSHITCPEGTDNCTETDC